MSLITLTTDFGLRDPYVAAMKGVMLGIAPDVRLVDVTHQVPPQDVMHAAFVLREAYPFFPPGTIHLAVVDPGVGTARRAVAVQADGHFFVGPDNGLFALVLGEHHVEEAVVLDQPEYWRVPEPAATFHGRDVFAPVAAHLARGYPLQALGTPLPDLRPLRWPLPIVDAEGVRGLILHVDHYGNCITNVRRADVDGHRDGRGVRGYVGSAAITALRPTYAEVPSGEPVLLYGSAGLLEVAVNGGNASELLDIHRGAPITLVFTPPA